MKKRGFTSDELEEKDPAPPPRTEPAPHAGKAIALVVASWVLPLRIIASLFFGDEQQSHTLHRVILLVSGTLVLVGLGFAIRAIDLARKSPRMRRRLAYGAVVLGMLTPVVWAGELALAFDVFMVRTRMEADDDGSAGPSGPSAASTLVGDASSPPAE